MSKQQRIFDLLENGMVIRLLHAERRIETEIAERIRLEKKYNHAIEFAQALIDSGDDEDEYWGQRFLNCLKRD